MEPLIEAASPLEVAALWRLNFLTGDDIAAICLRWLEEDLDRGDPDIATFAGQPDLHLTVAGPAFERFLQALVGRPIERDEAILRALRLHLAVIPDTHDQLRGVGRMVDRFHALSDHRLVNHPHRARDGSDGAYAGEELGLEYIYGSFYAFDDIEHLGGGARMVAETRLRNELREAVRTLQGHLDTLLERWSPLTAQVGKA